MTAPSYRDQIAGALRAIRLYPPAAFSWFGRRIGDLPRSTVVALVPEASRRYLLHNVRAMLYEGFYSAGVPTWAERLAAPGMQPGLTPFVEALSEANAGRGSVEPGWRRAARAAGEVVVERDGLRLFVGDDDLVGAGADVAVRLPKELLRVSPGFYMALGDVGLDAGERLLRFYWNLADEAAPRFMAIATALLNARGVAFRLKVVNRPERYTRCDAGVLYVHRRDHIRAASIMGEVYRTIGPDLKDAVPALTKRLAPGLGLAEDPGGGRSFGMHRCGLIAEGILRGHDLGEPAQDAVAWSFAEAGISLDAPYLDPGSSDAYG